MSTPEPLPLGGVNPPLVVEGPPSGMSGPSQDQSLDSTRSSTPSGNARPVTRRAMASFDNLVALANHQERLKTASQNAKKLVWRERGEPIVELESLSACLQHATAGFASQSLDACLRVFSNSSRVCDVGF